MDPQSTHECGHNDGDDDDDDNDENTSKPLVREYERNGWADWFITPSLIQFLEISKILWDLKKFEDSQQSRMRQKAELIFGATAATGGRVKIMSTA